MLTTAKYFVLYHSSTSKPLCPDLKVVASSDISASSLNKTMPNLDLCYIECIYCYSSFPQP